MKAPEFLRKHAVITALAGVLSAGVGVGAFLHSFASEADVQRDRLNLIELTVEVRETRAMVRDIAERLRFIEAHLMAPKIKE